MCEEDEQRKMMLVRPKSSFSYVLSNTSIGTLDPSLFISEKIEQRECSSPYNPSPQPIGKDVNVVAEVPIESNPTLLENKESVLECLEPLLDKCTATTGVKQTTLRKDVTEEASNFSLLENKESVLECLKPLLDRSTTTARGKRTRTPPTIYSNLESFDSSSEATPIKLPGKHGHEGGSPGNKKKRPRSTNRCVDDQVDLTGHQAALWQMRYQELVAFRQNHGHCLVPHKWPESLALATWVKRQRHQFKLKNQGRRSTLSDDRQQALMRLGFVFDSHNAIWEERFQELVAFKRENGHTNVPSTHVNHSLSVWVQCQRRQWKLMKESIYESQDSEAYQLKRSRAKRLQELGFVWEQRKRQQQG
jgi:hypothetical protein